MATKKASKQTAKSAAGNRQLKAILLFAVSVFLLALVFIKGDNFWTDMHNAVHGVFGITVYAYPFVLGAIAVCIAAEKMYKKTKVRLIETGLLFLLFSACIDIFSVKGKAPAFLDHLSEAYESGIKNIWSGGFTGALIGNPIFHAFGKIGAAITVILLMLVLLMLITGTTLISLYGSISKPAKTAKEISRDARDAYAERAERREKERGKDKKQLKIIKGFDVDMPVDEAVTRKNKDESLSEKQKKLVSIYNDEDEEEIPDEETEETSKLDEAIDEVEAEENDAEKPKRVTVDMEEETEKVSEEISSDESTYIGYIKPPINLLEAGKSGSMREVEAELKNTSEQLVSVLSSFGVETRIIDVSRGPTVTRYELQPKAGIKISKITGLADDIAMNLATTGVRIEAPIPNKAAVGIEVPNRQSATVGVREIIESTAFSSSRSKLTVALGKDIGGNVVVADIAKMPHGLIAGATGSGKSVCINSIIMSILYKANPDEVKLLMIDPKVVELGVYNGIPHLLIPVVTEPRKAAGALGWAVEEMEKRYRMFADRGVRDIEGYNRFVDGLTGEPDITRMPHIVIIIDELADLMITAPREVEDSINRIAAKARAAGMHLLIATQRPSVDVVTGVIKANIPTRIAFAVSSQVDSRTILDAAGAEKLLGKGDMLFSPVGSSKPKRVQGCFVSDDEVAKVVTYVKKAGKARYDDEIIQEIERQATMDKSKKADESESDGNDDDPILDEAIRVVVEMGQASTSLLQRKLKLGYSRAARIVDMMEERGIVGPYEGSKPRKVLITMDELNERLMNED